MQGLKYALYARKSTEDASKQVQSIPDQLKIMGALARTNDLNIVLRLQETQSASKPFIRPEFTALLQKITDGEINAIICWQLNRLSRNPTENGILQQLLQDGKIQVIQTIDRKYQSEDNALIFGVEASMSSQFVRDLMKNVRRGMHTKAERGWMPGVPPCGYKNNRESRTIIPDEERWVLVRQVWDVMLEGTHTVSEVARIADCELGLRTMPRRVRGDKPLSVSGIYALLQNPFYAGSLVYGNKTYVGKHKPMVTTEEFERVQALIKRRSTHRPSLGQETDPFPYRGLVRCGDCGCMITYTKKVKHYKNGTSQEFEYCYCTKRRKDVVCLQRNTISPHELTRQIQAELQKYGIIEEFFDLAMKYLSEYDALEIEKQEKLHEAQTRAIKTTEVELQGLQRMLYTGRCSEKFFDQENVKLERKLTSLQQRLESSQQANREWRETTKKVFSLARYAADDFASDDHQKKRQVLAELSQNLTLKDGKIVFIPVKYFVPIAEANTQVVDIKVDVGTQNQQMKKASEEAVFSAWCTRQDSNLRPLAPQANALSS